MVVQHRPLGMLLALVLAGCSAVDEAGNRPVPKKPPPTSCASVSDCPVGTKACISNFCVQQDCPDADGDGAGVGPGCAKFDCDDNDPSVPAASEVCGNGKDDDCNGLIDEGCVCQDEYGTPIPDGEKQACGGKFSCAGTQECVNGLWSSQCVGGKAPSPEICGNDEDEDCDGAKDNGCCPGSESVCSGTAVCSSNGICN